MNGRDLNAPRTVAQKLARALQFDQEGDAIMAKLSAEGSLSTREWQQWLRARAWAAKLRGQPAFTAEKAAAELVERGLRL